MFTAAPEGVRRQTLRSVNAATKALGPISKATRGDGGFVGYNPVEKVYFTIFNANDGAHFQALGSECNFNNLGQEYWIQEYARMIAFNPKSNSYAVITESNDMAYANRTTVFRHNGYILGMLSPFAWEGAKGLYSPVIEANTIDGTYAALTTRDYAITEFIAGLLPLICDPLPADPDIISQCAANTSNHPPQPVLPTGTDPSNPVISSTLQGAHGVGAAYDSKNDQVLFLANTYIDGTGQVWGEIRKASDLQIVVPPFRIDQGPADGYAGEPKAIYNPDTNQYLIVWEDSRAGERSRHIYARIMNADGTFTGNDFPVFTQGNAFLTSVDYDPVNKKYVVLYEVLPGGPLRVRTIDLQGNLGLEINVVQPDGLWRGHSNIAVNTGKNEYWVTYVAAVSGGDTPQEDNRLMLSRINAQTSQPVGEPIQLSETRIGRNAVSYPDIAYSPTDGKTMVVWLERGKDGEIAGVYGRTVDNNLNLSEIYPVATTFTAGYSSAFFNPDLNYNPSTNTFFVTAEDNDGGTVMVELDSSGFIYETRQPIAPPCPPDSPPSVLASARCGNFWPTNIPTNSGVVVLASWGYHNVNATVYNSPFAGVNLPEAPIVPETPRPPVQIDTSSLPKLINQIYIWSLGIAGLLALLMMILGGYIYMTAAGNAQQAAKGKEYIMSSLVGVVLLLGAFLLLKTINPQLVQFNLSSVNPTQRP